MVAGRFIRLDIRVKKYSSYTFAGIVDGVGVFSSTTITGVCSPRGTGPTRFN
jgi:hypothetical protein